MENLKVRVIGLLMSEGAAVSKFNELLYLYMADPGHISRQAAFYNRSLYTAANYEQLVYDIKVLYGISDLDLVVQGKPKEVLLELEPSLLYQNLEAISLDMQVQLCIEFAEKSKLDELMPIDIPEFTKGLPGVKQMKDFMLQLGSVAKGTKKVDLKKEIEALHFTLSTEAAFAAFENLKEAKSVLLKKNELDRIDELELAKGKVSLDYSEAPNDVKDGLKLRAEFSFLSEQDCPDKLKILVSDKFTALENFQAAHSEIQKMVSAGYTDGLLELGKAAVENWELNQLIYDELNHYQDHGEVLGVHKIFEDEKLQRRVAAIKNVDLIQSRANLRSRISQEKSKFKKATVQGKEKIQLVIAEKQLEIDLIQTRINESKK